MVHYLHPGLHMHAPIRAALHLIVPVTDSFSIGTAPGRNRIIVIFPPKPVPVFYERRLAINSYPSNFSIRQGRLLSGVEPKTGSQGGPSDVKWLTFAVSQPKRLA